MAAGSITAVPRTLAGKTVAVTGSTGGLGQALCRHYARLGARLILLNRSAARTEAQIAALRAEFPDLPTPAFIKADLLDPASLGTAADALAALPLDILVHNAGLYAAPRVPFAGGYDNIFAVNFLSPYYLTRRVLPTLRARGGHVALVSSIAGGRIHTKAEDPAYEKCRRAAAVYGNAKRHLLIALAELLAGEGGVTLGVGHPGITPTGITSHYPRAISALIKWPMRLVFAPPEAAARSVVEATLTPTAAGEWYGPRAFGIWGKPRLSHYLPATEQEAAGIRQVAEQGYARLTSLT